MKKLRIWIIIAVILALLAAGTFIFRGELGDLLFPVKNGWDEEDGKYYFNDWEGEHLTGWLHYDGANYYLDPAAGGAMRTGWLELEKGTYYLDESGRSVTGWQELEGKTRYFLEDGLLASGWLDMADGRRWFDKDGASHLGWLDTDKGRFYLDETGKMHTGWLNTDKGRFYLDETGKMYTGWLELDGFSYYLDESGCMHTGWLNMADGSRRYLQADGTLAKGRVIIDEEVWHFTSTGAPVVLVNRWNPVPESYETELVYYGTRRISADCVNALDAMLDDCPIAYTVTDLYRSEATQAQIWDRYIRNYMDMGFTYEGAVSLTAAYVAYPGTSEHQLGLAADIRGSTALQEWLAENCWDYGFILRYPDEKQELTGIGYENWHFRYVGLELAQELKGTGLCLEEYIDALTTDSSTCSDPDNLTAKSAGAAE